LTEGRQDTYTLEGINTNKAIELSVLEIGCGTGVLSLQLLPYVKSILAIDVSHPMIQILRLKIAALSSLADRKKITPLCLYLEDAEDPHLPPGPDGKRMKFDMVTGHLLLHHVADHESLLRTMHGCLKPGGRIALTDFEDIGPQARLFHPEGKMGDVEHDRGIDAEVLARLMETVGFEDVSVEVAWTMSKEVEDYPGQWGPKALQRPETAEAMDFSFLLCTARKSAG
jgi:2-polyprenyl-3-methyl-5-hydroxy-6-metoxy-1,4-benzoquinol methylase